MSNIHCNSCDREVGAKNKRPVAQIILFAILGIISIVAIMYYEQSQTPTFAQAYLTRYRGSLDKTGISSLWWAVPIPFFAISIYKIFQVTKKCPICNSEL